MSWEILWGFFTKLQPSYEMLPMRIAGITRNRLFLGVIVLLPMILGVSAGFVLQHGPVKSNVPAKPGWVPWDIQAQSHQLLLKKDFKGLDALAAALKAKGYDIRQDNKTEIDAFYEGFKVSDKDSDEAWRDRLKLLQQWVAADPNSLSAHIALASWYTYLSWSTRETDFEATVSALGAGPLDSAVESAAKSLNSVRFWTPIDDPVYYAVWINICLLQGRSKEEMFNYLNRCIALAKEYEPIYLAAGNFLSEQWHGEHGEREKWMKTWADSFSPEKGDLLYAFLLSSDARNIGEATFKLDVDYDRARNALEKRIVEDNPEWNHDENVLCFLAVVKNDDSLTKKLLFDLEGMVNTRFYDGDKQDGTGERYYSYLRGYFGVDQGFNQAMALERSGKLADAEKLLRSFTFHPLTYLPLAYFYERQGMRDALMAMDYLILGKPLKEMVDTDIYSASPEYLAELASYYPMMGSWDKAEAVAKQFDQLRPMNLIGKNILLLCAIRRHDSSAEQAALQEIINLKTDRPVYLAAQTILSGSESWEQASHTAALSKTDPYLSQGITAIALYYMSNGNNAEARSVIEQSLPICADNSGKTLLQSLLFGSLSNLTALPAPPAIQP